MKRLILMRHAKSDWSDLSASDHARPLNTRGRRSARALGEWLRGLSIRPDHVLCSDSIRTTETLSHLALGDDVPLTTTRDLYLAEPDVMAVALRRMEGDCVLIIGHNPGCAVLADILLAQRPDHETFDRFPTCATLIADFEISSWRDLKIGTGTAVHFTVPRDLTK